ncbi:MAG: MBL fold metallo-hydrolase [Planctomycetota bacterium]|nr:MBL fold metallo-hydrolase [Planctomycetota bacterium]MDA1138889.1 MBL fold metallo-hydrolase [Planctomycetota bacterium]
MPLSICVLASGSSGNATFVSSGNTHLLIDSGLSTTELQRRIKAIGYETADINGILITHAHSDHYRAAGSLSRRLHIPVFAPQTTIDVIRSRSSKKRYRRLGSADTVPDAIGDISIKCFPVQHGGEDRNAGEPIGFVVTNGDASFALATDVGRASQEIIAALQGTRAVQIESNYDEEILNRKLTDPEHRTDWEYLRWVKSDDGHLSNTQCAELLALSISESTTDIFLGHLSENHPNPKSDNNSFELARQAVIHSLRQAEKPIPAIHRTYRTGLRKGQSSILLKLE